jgi:hypothetical protein
MKRTIKAGFSAIVMIWICLPVIAVNQGTIKSVVESIREFDYGQSLKSQRELDRLINEIYGQPDLRAYMEKQILAALQSEKTTPVAKTYFCQKLSLIGSEASIPVLSGMLLHDESVAMACGALKTIPSPRVDECLRESLDSLHGESKKTVIQLLGERRDENAIGILNKIISANEPEAAKTAIHALGNIGTLRCAEILSKFRNDRQNGWKFDLADACLQCAVQLKKEGKINESADLLRQLNHGNEPSIIQRGARWNLLELGRLDIDFDRIEPISLFNGSSFEGWNGNLDFFRIEDGSIVAGNLDKSIPRNEFLSTNLEYGNFELRLQCKLSSKDANAGIQIRSRRVPNSHEMRGYQADMGQQYWGCLYDESRRNVVLAEPNKENLSKALRLTDWNEYVIRCMGRRIQLWINGCQTVDYLEPDESLSQMGLIGLQIHAGAPAEAHYKNIEIRVFDDSSITN